MNPANKIRARIAIQGAVQGVGFRPFVYRLAKELKLSGWVNNSNHGVSIEVEGDEGQIRNFLLRLEPEKPPHAFIHSLESSYLASVGYAGFKILESQDAGDKTTFILPDIATCPDCLRELFDPQNRRYRYPFINCTHCGPRFSIITALPYDRPNTSMQAFTMCAACQSEYDNPDDRRFHAQPNACPQCGPQLSFWDATGQPVTAGDSALQSAVNALRQGQIIAVKGLGGFHLMVDARNTAAVQRLRERKHREEKPFALMFPSLEQARQSCQISDLETRLLLSAESPIVLLQRQSADSEITESVAPGNPSLGIMLPYTPLHHLLMRELGFPVVATSGNRSDEPICIDERDAGERLHGIADGFLVHNRPIVRQVDDSIVRISLGREMVLRRSRGYAPLPITLKKPLPPILAVGAHLKNTVGLAVGNHVFLSQHIGDLETPQANEAFQRVIADFQKLYATTPTLIACDTHPDYLSTQFAQKLGGCIVACQHHAAHVAACLAENELEGPALGISWDGTGLGSDGTIWGGEFIVMHRGEWKRVGHLRTFCLPGGEAAVKEPRRCALGMLHAMYGPALWVENAHPILELFTPAELKLLRQMLAKSLNSPVTSSMGRLFDGVAALVLAKSRMNFEGQAAMELEWAIQGDQSHESYPFALVPAAIAGQPEVLDWAPTIEGVLNDLRFKVVKSRIAVKFHNTMAEMAVAVARRVGEPNVALTGGCFQNRYLTARTVERLRAEGFIPCWHQRVPPNDGGIALGQAVMAGYQQIK